MRKFFLAFIAGALLVSCGTAKDVSDATEEVVDETTETVEETTEDVNEVIEDNSNITYDGIIKDKSTTEGCTFLIETDLGEGTVLLEPVHLQEEYKQDGLKVNFTFTYSKRPSKCGIATPILLGTITG